ncbi:MAG: argininosuccinate synthase, partial [Gammaproteobacteria bacterium]|nr:argininosuccinate synthase [Gammaproteobacteria bacterium]
MINGTNPIILAFSGGLDTSFCVPWLEEAYGRPVVTATINTGGLDAAAAAALAVRSRKLGAAEHILIEARDEFFDRVLKFLIIGNVRRGQLYPLCVGEERGIQARHLAEVASQRGATTVAHGCTAAGNDQVRFEIILKTLAPELEVLAPVRDFDWPREDQLAYLKERNLPAPASGSAYSINRGLWGVTIGGTETLDSVDSIPESAWVLSAGAFDSARAATEITIGFARGVPVTLNGKSLGPVELIEQLEQFGRQYGIGRGIHLGDTILGTKGRVAFEAPAAAILLTCHREIEKLTLTALQQRVKEQLSLTYGDLVHEG